MRHFYKIFSLLAIFIFSCEIEKINNDDEAVGLDGNSSKATELDCSVIDADRAPYTVGTTGDPIHEMPSANLWWPNSLNENLPFDDYFIASNYYGSLEGHGLTFEEFPDNTARLNGSTKSNDGNCVVEIDVWFKNKKSWAEWQAIGGQHKKEGTAGNNSNSEEMSFYIIDSEKSRLTSIGSDCYAEGTYGLMQRPDPNDNASPNFGAHIGPGGANYDSNLDALGLSTWGWMTDLDTGEPLWVMDFNFVIDCPEEPCDECDGKVTELSLQYKGGEVDANIVVTQKKDDIVVYDGIVQPDEIFSFSGEDKKGTLGTEIIITVNGNENTKIHTSCSKPIGPGLMSGDFLVVDGASLEGGKLCPIETPPGGDCDECDGKATYLQMQYNGAEGADITVTDKKGETEIFSGFVDAGGSFDLQGFDKKGTLGTEIVFYINGSQNTKIHTSCSKPIGPGLISGSFEVLEGTSGNGGAMCPVETIPGGDCDECDGKATYLLMQYNGAEGADITVTDKKGEAEIFSGFVEAGGSFDLQGFDKKGTLGTEIVLLVNGHENSKIHTSCSKPIGPGLISGSFEVLEGTSRNGGPMCPVDPSSGDDDDDDDDDDKDCGDCDGKAINLELQYNGASAAQISVVQKKNLAVVYNEMVEPGTSFFFEGSADDKGTLGTEIIIYIDNVENTRIHTSCSKPLGLGLISGAFEIVGGASRNGGEFCPL